MTTEQGQIGEQVCAALAKAFDQRFDQDLATLLQNVLRRADAPSQGKVRCLFVLAEMGGQAKEIMKLAVSDENEEVSKTAKELLSRMK